MNFLLSYLKGICLGAGAILPGISSGVLCVVFGIYDKLIDSILNFFHNIKSNFLFLLPVVLGIGTGVVLFGNILFYLFETFPIQVAFTFIGIILGSIPLLLKEAHTKQGFRLSYLIYMIFSILITIILVILERNITYNLDTTNSLYLVMCGFFMSVGVVVPGVSSSAILMCLGVYNTYLASISNLYFPVLIPMGIGLILGGLLFLKAIQYLLRDYHIQTYYSIIGFVLGSVLIIYPGFTLDYSYITGLICCALGFKLANLVKNGTKKKTLS